MCRLPLIHCGLDVPPNLAAGGDVNPADAVAVPRGEDETIDHGGGADDLPITQSTPAFADDLWIDLPKPPAAPGHDIDGTNSVYDGEDDDAVSHCRTTEVDPRRGDVVRILSRFVDLPGDRPAGEVEGVEDDF